VTGVTDVARKKKVFGGIATVVMGVLLIGVAVWAWRRA